MNFFNHDYTDISTFINTPNSKSSTISADLIFPYKSFFNEIDCIHLLQQFDFHVPNRDLGNNNGNFPTIIIINIGHHGTVNRVFGMMAMIGFDFVLNSEIYH